MISPANPTAENDVEIPEVLPPEGRGPRPTVVQRLSRAIGPVAGGLIVDSVDLATYGSMGLVIGSFIGASVSYYICSVEKLPVWQRVVISAIGGIYCAAPRTEFIPAATLIGALIRFWQDDKKKK